MSLTLTLWHIRGTSWTNWYMSYSEAFKSALILFPSESPDQVGQRVYSQRFKQEALA